MVVLLFLSSRLLEVHTEIFMGGIRSCLELCIRPFTTVEEAMGREENGEGGGQGGRRWVMCLYSLSVYSQTSL